MVNLQLDSIDRRILSVLQKEGRTSNADLAENINLSPSACHRRVQRLHSIGVIKNLCQFLEIDYNPEMLKVPVVGSSTQQDVKNQLLIDISKKEKWKNGGLNSAEIYLSQLVSNSMMRKFKYDVEKFKLPPILTLFYLISFPIKLILAFILNIKRTGNIVEVIKKRFCVK